MPSSFEDLEKSVFAQDQSVFGDFDGNRIFGTLILKREDTLVDIICDSSVGVETTEQGWFDLALSMDQGHKVLLHNALDIAGPMIFRTEGKTRQKIFPNNVILRAEKLTDDLKVKRIHFNIEKGDDFFNYRRMEWQPVGNLKGATKNLLSRLRKQTQRKYHKDTDRDYDLTDPDEIYFRHNESDCIEFNVGTTSYKIYTSDRSQHGMGNNISIEYDPGFNIEFTDPVSISEAFSAMGSWHRFMNQIAMRRLGIKGVSASGSLNPRDGSADIYMPNEPEIRDHPHSRFGPHHTPYSRYKEREELTSLHKTWLSKNDERVRFRTMLDHVINGNNNANSITKIGMLCSGIETLPYKLKKKPMSKANADALAKTAFNKSKRLKLPFDYARIRGLVGTLNKPGLKGFLEHMYDTTITDFDPKYKSALIKQVIRLRNVAGHGDPEESLDQPIARSVEAALTSLCILYDLVTSGMPHMKIRKDNLLADETFRHACFNLNVK